MPVAHGARVNRNSDQAAGFGAFNVGGGTKNIGTGIRWKEHGGSRPDQRGDERGGLETHRIDAADRGVGGDGFGFDFNYVAGQYHWDLRARAVLQAALIAEGEVAGPAEGQERGGYSVGVGLTSYGCEYDVVERLRDIKLSDILGHAVGITCL